MLPPPITIFDAWDTSRAPSSGNSGLNFESRQAITELQHKVERQHLFIQTLLRLLMEKGLIQENEFREWLTFVDGFDGNVDGKLRHDASPQTCGSCGRKSPASSPKCQYCGSEFVRTVLEPDKRPS